MKRYLLFSFLFLFLCQWAGSGLYAQADPDRGLLLDEEKWGVLAEGMDFPPPSGIQAEQVERAPNNLEGERRWAIFLKTLAVLAVVGIIALILRYLLGGEALFSPKNRKFEKGVQIDLENIEAHLPEANVPAFIEKALVRGDYRMATRLHYLALIQALARKEWIDWQPEKTNGDYLQEIQTYPVFDRFRELTNVFERIWYGDYPLEKETYRLVADQFAIVENEIETVNALKVKGEE